MRGRFAPLAVLALLALAAPAAADDDFFRSSPGPLSASHAAIDACCGTAAASSRSVAAASISVPVSDA